MRTMRRSLVLIVGSALLIPLIAAARTTVAAKPGAVASKATIHGRVTDFAGKPVEGADVELKTSRFESAAAAKTGADGSYSLTVDEGMYIALAAVKDYRTKSLEYWAWNVPAFGDVRIDPRFDRLEVYAVNAWRPQGAYPSYQVYFRPMSLTMTAAAVVKAGGMEGLGKLALLDIAPALEAGDIEVKINGERVDVLRVSRIKEAGGPSQDLYAYVAQVALPKAPALGDWVTFDVTLTDRATGEKGEARLYLARTSWR